MATLRQFAKRMRDLGGKVSERANLGKQRVAIQIDQLLVMATPVDTGRARSNWMIAMNAPANGTIDADRGSAGTIAQNEAAIRRSTPTQEIHITNNLPYIVPLNQGHSAQAPAGFVERAIATGANEAARVRLIT